MMADDSIDAIVTDPPYGLRFMGKRWDYDVPGVDIWQEALRVLKPGGHLLAFGGTRTYHRMAVAIEDAGFEIRDQIQWVYGSGFPKSLDVSKAIDAAAGAEREVVGNAPYSRGRANQSYSDTRRVSYDYPPQPITKPATPDAERWDGWGTALKPANEPICMARKPLAGTVAANVLAWGTGAINVDGCRVGTEGDTTNERAAKTKRKEYSGNAYSPIMRNGRGWDGGSGRWPANFIHDGSEEVTALFPVTGPSRGTRGTDAGNKMYGGGKGLNRPITGQEIGYGDTGSAARFFYTAKASKRERDAGLDGMELRDSSVGDRRPSGSMTQRIHADEGRPNTLARNHHPTVKPISLMRYLVRLITPPGGTVLDPFCGSGSTGCGAVLEGFNFVGIERDAEYVEIARLRIGHWIAEQAFGLFAEAAD